MINFFTHDTTRNSFKNIPVLFVETPNNQDEARTFGGSFGFSGKHIFSRFGLSYYCYYSFIDGDLNNEQLPFAAKHTVKTGLTFTLGDFSISPRYAYRTETFSLIEDSEGSLVLCSRWRLGSDYC